MEMTGKRTYLLLFFLVSIIITGVWTVQNGSVRTTSVPNTTAQNTSDSSILPDPVCTCTEIHGPIPAGGMSFSGSPAST